MVVQKYLCRISGPLFDRIDIHIEVVPVPFDKLSEVRESETSETVRNRVMIGRKVQEERFKLNDEIHCNAQMSSKLIRQHCELDSACQILIKTAMEKLGLSARAYDRILKVSRTIADLEQSEVIQAHHLAEAIQYRSLDRDGWAG